MGGVRIELGFLVELVEVLSLAVHPVKQLLWRLHILKVQLIGIQLVLTAGVQLSSAPYIMIGLRYLYYFNSMLISSW